MADGAQPWLAKIGLGFSGLQMIVTTVTDAIHQDMKLTWRPQERVSRFTAPEDIRELATDDESGKPRYLRIVWCGPLRLFGYKPRQPYQ